MSKVRLRIKEVVTKSGVTIYYPQYKGWFFWHSIKYHTTYDSWPFHSILRKEAEQACRDFQAAQDARTVVRTNYEELQ